MSSISSKNTDQWSSRYGFLLASIGFAVGMGNIWRFPYVTGQNGGSAFLIIYLACALLIGLPLLITELTIGKRGRSSAPGSIINIANESGVSKQWGKGGKSGCSLRLYNIVLLQRNFRLDSGLLFLGPPSDIWKI